MRALRLAIVILCATAGVAVAAATAQADGGNSDAAHRCLNGPQTDYYIVVGQPGQEADVDFGDLVHGYLPSAAGVPDSDTGVAFVDTDSHGQCVSFFAKATKGTKARGKPTIQPILIVKTVDVSSPS